MHSGSLRCGEQGLLSRRGAGASPGGGSRRTGFTSAWLKGSAPRLRSCGARA